MLRAPLASLPRTPSASAWPSAPMAWRGGWTPVTDVPAPGVGPQVAGQGQQPVGPAAAAQIRRCSTPQEPLQHLPLAPPTPPELCGHRGHRTCGRWGTI